MSTKDKLSEHQRQNAENMARTVGKKFEQQVGHSRRPAETKMEKK